VSNQVASRSVSQELSGFVHWRVCRIVYWPLEFLRRIWERREEFGIRKDDDEVLRRELDRVDWLRELPFGPYADLCERTQCVRVNWLRSSSGTLESCAGSESVTGERLGQLASTGISNAEEEDMLHWAFERSNLPASFGTSGIAGELVRRAFRHIIGHLAQLVQSVRLTRERSQVRTPQCPQPYRFMKATVPSLSLADVPRSALFT
jgi:hypothetical protein